MRLIVMRLSKLSEHSATIFPIRKSTRSWTSLIKVATVSWTSTSSSQLSKIRLWRWIRQSQRLRLLILGLPIRIGTLSVYSKSEAHSSLTTRMRFKLLRRIMKFMSFLRMSRKLRTYSNLFTLSSLSPIKRQWREHLSTSAMRKWRKINKDLCHLEYN